MDGFLNSIYNAEGPVWTWIKSFIKRLLSKHSKVQVHLLIRRKGSSVLTKPNKNLIL